ncbi:SpoIIE family protein phosphatase [Orrella sp. JC864]
MALFSSDRDLGSLAVIEQGRPIGLINRNIFLSQMSKPFHRELYDRKSCIAFMDKSPLVVDAQTDVDALMHMTVQTGKKALADGFIITRQGRYAGMGNSLQLLSMIAAIQEERNRQVMQSIEYASVIQRAMLRTSRSAVDAALGDAALVWQPRDVVGGDFYHFGSYPEGWFGAVADCTGHGVPGAFMTLIASSSLSQALEHDGPRRPSALLSAVNRGVKSMLGQVKETDAPESNDGLDAAFFWFDRGTGTLTFSGARIALYVLRPQDAEFEIVGGQRKGVGYIDTPMHHTWTEQALQLPPGTLLFATTDGLTDQIGGPKNIAFGRRRACQAILAQRHAPAAQICQALLAALAQWQGQQARRDDLTLFCARL